MQPLPGGSRAGGTPLLSVDDLSVSYGLVEALHSVSLVLDRGHPVAVVGPNGAGKTSLLRALSGLVKPSGGSASLAGKRITGRPAYRVAREGFVHVPEGRGIIAPLTVHENLLMGAYSVDAATAENRLEEMTELFPVLRDRLKQQAGLLSGGEQQMLAIARGLMSEPKVLAIDEPSMGLAPVIVDDVVDGLQRALSGGVALLLVEQNVRLALELAETVYVLVNGRVAMSGGGEDIPEDLLETYVETGG